MQFPHLNIATLQTLLSTMDQLLDLIDAITFVQSKQLCEL